MADTFYWYDYETTGIDAARDRVVQFAGIRTDQNFQQIAEPDVFYCQLADDVLPHPEACLITGITPQLANQQGLLECDFIAKIHQQFSRPNTCVVGYNSIRFDDEFTRHLLYRNFFDPYAREWKSGNSRWDLIDVVRLTQALRPEGINWPRREDGSASFKLEELTKANGISHESAHDALSDVYATIALAQLIKQQQPKLYSWGLALRDKKKAAENLDLIRQTAVVHVSSKFPASQDCLAVVMPIAIHPVNKNAVLVVDLSVDPESLIKLTAEQIHQRLYTATVDLADTEERIPLKAVHLNKSPMLAPLNTLTAAVKDKLSIDLERCEQHRQRLLAANIADKVRSVFSLSEFAAVNDPDLMLYSGGFFSYNDVACMQQIRDSSVKQLAELSFAFEDERLYEMLFRYRARNYPDSLSNEERLEWDEHRSNFLKAPSADGRLSLDDFFATIERLQADAHAANSEQAEVLNNLLAYGRQLVSKL